MKNAFIRIVLGIVFALALYLPNNLLAQGTAFTYQGRLNDGTNPATGSYDLRFAIYDSTTGGAQQGPLLTNSPTGVTNGLFTVTLDFGNQFPGAARWLEIAVRTNGAGSFTTLATRQMLTPTPYAVTAGNVTSGGLAAGIYANAVIFNNAANNFSGSFTGNGANVTNVNAATLGGQAAGDFWQLGGNNVSAGQFLGSTNNQPVEIRAYNMRVLRIEPDAFYVTPNIIGGSAANYVGAGCYGNFIGAGGQVGFSTNSILSGSSLNFIGGGAQNTISNSGSSVISGGLYNTIGASHGVVAGGEYNLVLGWGGVIGGGDLNTNLSIGAVIGGGGYDGISFVGNRINGGSAVSVIGGGIGNTIATNANYSTISGGFYNTILPNANYATIPGGYLNTATNQAFAAGTRAKAVNTGAFVWADAQSGDFASTGSNQFLIRASGGIGINTNNPNGAALNVAGTIVAATVQSANFTGNGGGLTNVNAPTLGGLASSNFWQLGGNSISPGQFLGTTNIQPLELMAGNQRAFRLEYGASLGPNVLGGSSLNAISNGVYGATIGGGGASVTIFSSTFYYPNTISGGALGTIGGGGLNSVGTNFATISGGYNNLNLGQYSTIGGGSGNRVEGGAVSSVISGGGVNTNSGQYATVPGGTLNAATGDYSYAAGRRAKANHQGAYVWADSQDTNFTSTAPDQFLIRAAGNVGINTNNPGATLDVNGSIRVGTGTTVFKNLQGGIAQMASGSSTVKTNFTFNFPKAFSAVPTVVISPSSGNSVPVDDTFAVTVRAVTTTSCTVNVVRVDNPSGWSQQVKINWIAWE